MNFWEEIIEKVINAEAKALLQIPTGARKINLKYFQENRPVKKEEKNSGRTKSTNTLSNDVSSNKYQQFSAYQNPTDKKD